MKDRLALVDMLNLADLIMGLPLQIEIEIGSAKYLLAHAMTFDSAHGVEKEALYLEGLEEMQEYWEHGVKGYVSFFDTYLRLELRSKCTAKYRILTPV